MKQQSNNANKNNMKKIFENLYIFSKFAFTFTLFICFLGLLYIFYINYKKEDIITNNQNVFEEKINNSIVKNSDLINNISNEINVTKSEIKKINKNFEIFSKQITKKDLTILSANIDKLSNEFKNLSMEIDKIKNNNSKIVENNSNPEIINNSKDEIIDLILIKYENNKNFDKELQYLYKILNEQQIPNYEKLLILKAIPFKGYDYIIDIFDMEVNFYLKEIINNNPDSIFNKIILPYVKVAPTSENKIDSDVIIKIKRTKKHLENRDIENAFASIKTIENYNNFFNSSLDEITKYLKFKSELTSVR